MGDNEETILRTLAWFSSFKHAPTAFTIWKWQIKPERILSFKEIVDTLIGLEERGVIVSEHGTYHLKGSSAKSYDQRVLNSISSIRKFNRAKRVAKFASILSPVRAVAVCNTQLPLMDSSEDSDIDFFVITAPGQTWLTRFLCLTPFALLKKRPGQVDRDAIDFSFFLSEEVGSIEEIVGEGREYLASWIYSLVPLFGSGAIRKFQASNNWASEIFPVAKPSFKEEDKKFTQLPFGWIKNEFIEKWQMRKMPEIVKQSPSPGVILEKNIIKTHVKDLSAKYVKKYQELCKELQIKY